VSVHKFGRPELDDEIITVMERIEVSEKALKFFMGEREAVRRVREALGRNPNAMLTGLVDEEIACFDRQIETADAAIAVWKEIQEILVARSAKP